MSDRIVSREEFISAVGVNGNPVQMAQRSALLINHDRALRAERDALRADLKALERAVLYYNDVRADSEAGGCWVIPPCKPGEGKYNVCAHHWLLDTARFILDRVAGEGAL